MPSALALTEALFRLAELRVEGDADWCVGAADPIMALRGLADGVGCIPGMAPDEQRGGFGVRWAREHYREMIVLRLLVAVWIVFVTVFACVKGYWWGLAFLLFLALDLGLLRSLVHTHRAQGG